MNAEGPLGFTLMDMNLTNESYKEMKWDAMERVPTNVWPRLKQA